MEKNLAALKSTKRDILRMGRFIICAIYVGPDYSHNGPIMKVSLDAVAFSRELKQDRCTAAVYEKKSSETTVDVPMSWE